MMSTNGRKITGIPHDQRRCTKCDRVLPKTREYFPVSNKGYLSSWCRDCKNAGDRARHRARKAPPSTGCLARVVKDVATGQRRALWYHEDGPAEGEVWVGMGSHHLELSDKPRIEDKEFFNDPETVVEKAAGDAAAGGA